MNLDFDLQQRDNPCEGSRVAILVGSAIELLGFDLQSMHTIPGGLWEFFIGVWLIVKGFNAVPVVSEPA